jgi:hypothetical protein
MGDFAERVGFKMKVCVLNVRGEGWWVAVEGYSIKCRTRVG